MDSGLIILRPAAHVVRFQLLVLGALAVTAFGLVAAFGDRFNTILLGALILLMVVGIRAYYRRWMGRHSPAAIVATPEYVAVLDSAGQRIYVPWETITAANHATTVRGMRWHLQTAQTVVTLRDIGIHADRWGLLWRVVWPEVARRGAPVHVDALSNALFD